MRAHGDSEKATWGHRIARYAKDVTGLIKALRLERVAVLGWSRGAAILGRIAGPGSITPSGSKRKVTRPVPSVPYPSAVIQRKSAVE